MKNNLFFKVNAFIFALLFLCSSVTQLGAQAVQEPQSEVSISMDFQDANMKDVLKVFSIQSGLNFIASEALQDRKITLYLDKVPLSKAMDKLFSANNLSYELDKGSNIFVVKDWGKPQAETITKVFYLKHATVSSSSLKEEMYEIIKNQTTYNFTLGANQNTSSSSNTSSTSGQDKGKWKIEEEAGITNVIKKLLSEYGTVIEDYRTNSLIVSDIPSRMAVVTQVIASLDVPVPQVLLEVEILDVSKNVVDKIGFKYGQSPFTAVLTGATATMGWPFHSWGKLVEAANGSLGIDTGTNTYQVQLDLLRTNTETKFLARPKVLTLNNETAEIRIATNESVGVITTTAAAGGSAGTTTSEAERAETGVILRITPQINLDSGEITMFVYPKVAESTAGQTITIGNTTYSYRDPEERSTKSIVKVKDGDTVVMGGLIRNEFLQTKTKVPFLGDIPILGPLLFTHVGGSSNTGDKNKQRELLIFITPYIIKDGENIKLAQSQKPVLPEREQSANYGVTRESLINSTLNSFQKIKK